MNKIPKARFFWGSKKQAAELIPKETELKIMQYRGQIEFFLDNVPKFEAYLADEKESE
jgi:hypothetical protein